VQVWSYSQAQGWVQRGADLPVSFASGDRFGARRFTMEEFGLSDAATHRLVWYGSATAVVNPSLRDQRMPDAMQRVFAGFPSRGQR